MWEVTPAGTYLEEMREDIGLDIDWDGTPDGAWTSAAAELAFRVDQGGALLLSTMLLDTAPIEVVTARALAAGITPRPATFSRYIVEANGTGQLISGTSVQGGGPNGTSTWLVVDDTANVVPGDKVTIEATESGPITLPSTVTLTLVAPAVGLAELTYDSADGDAFQLGRVAESRAELIARIRAQGGGEGSEPSLRSEVLGLDWVVATNIAAGGGVLAVTVAPAPVGADQEAELADAIYRNSFGVTYAGSLSTTITDVNGDPLAILYTAGTTQAVATVAALVLDGTVTAADAIDAAESALQSEFAALSNGDPILYHRAYSALNLPGVLSYTLTLDGGVVSVSPTNAADILTATITVTAS